MYEHAFKTDKLNFYYFYLHHLLSIYIYEPLSKIDSIQIPNIDSRDAKYQGGQKSPGGVVRSFSLNSAKV
jgi:hypothetical protein